MSVTMHKLLVHPAAIAKSCIPPVGTSKKTAEATNKCVQKFRIKHTMKDSRKH